MTREKALEQTLDILRILIPKSLEYNIAIYEAQEKGDMEWFKMQLDELIDYCKELKESL